MLDSQGFRLNVAIVLVNQKNDVFLAKRVKQNGWQFPQGGIDQNENIITAMYRELKEEIGLDQEDVSIIASSKNWFSYKIPVRLRRKNDQLFVGQKQKWFLLRFNGHDSKFCFDLSGKPEFDDWQWVSYWYPLRVVIDFKKHVYCRALRELSYYLNKNNIEYNKLDSL